MSRDESFDVHVWAVVKGKERGPGEKWWVVKVRGLAQQKGRSVDRKLL